MEFKRHIDNKLVEFKQQTHAKPQVIFGVRQCGKTTAVLNHAKLYKNHIYINFEMDLLMQHFFANTDLNPEEMIETISLLKRVPFYGKDTLIIFDEIQISNRALTSLKYFCESANSYKIIALGSLLGTKIQREKFSFPVGKIDIHYMYPLTFFEYLMATDNEQFIPIIEKAFAKNKLVDVVHQQILQMFDTYIQIGGMPEAVVKFIESKDYGHVQTVHRNLQDGYLADMVKYSNNDQSTKILHVYNNLALQIGKENQKFMLKHLERGATMRKYEGAIDWLVAANMGIKVGKVSKNIVPLATHVEVNQFKLFLHDIGMLNSQQQYIVNESLADDRIYLGIIMENYAAMELAHNFPKLYYYDDNSKEVDYLLNCQNNIIVPLEIKASNNVKSKSLKTFMEQNNTKLAVRASRRNFGFDGIIKSIPLYAIRLLDEKLN